MKIFHSVITRTSIFVYLILPIPFLTKAQPNNFPDSALLKSHIDNIFTRYNATTPGAAIAVLYNDEIKFVKAYGSANLEYDIPNTTSTRFHVASLAKQFTAFSILLLQENGKLSLDDDVRKYIPEVPDFGYTITLRHLASHTSGLRDQWNSLLIAGVRPDDVINNEHVLAFVSEQKELNFIPGEEYLYCNTGYALLAEVVSRVSGQSFSAFTQENIFTPLKMTKTLFVDDHESVIKDRAYSYYSRDGITYSKRVLSYGNVGPTNLLTTAEDISYWMMNFKNQTVGSNKIFEQMTMEVTLNNGKTFGGGLGLFVNHNNGILGIEHGGADAGFRAQLSLFPTQGFGVVVLSNDAHCDAQQIASDVSAFCLKTSFTSVALPVKKKKEQKFIKLKPGSMEPFVGHYWTKERAFTRYIYLKNDTLMHFRTKNNESPLAPVGKNEFKVMNVPVNAMVRFEEMDGEMKLIETVNDGAPVLLERFVPVVYTDADWMKYVGEYYSDELKTTYAIEWHENKLVARHIRTGSIELTIVKHNFFKGDKGFFGSVEFIRDAQENVTGFRVSNGRVRNLLFEKRNMVQEQ